MASFALQVRPIERLNVALSAGAVAAAASVASPLFAASVALGALIEALNFRGLALQCQGFFGSQLGTGGGAWAVLSVLRLAVLATVLLAAIRQGAEPAGLVVGLSTILPAAVIAGFWLRPAPMDPSLAPPAPPPDDPSWDLWNPWLSREREPSEDGDDPEEPT
jgi:hypothetical protein